MAAGDGAAANAVYDALTAGRGPEVVAAAEIDRWSNDQKALDAAVTSARCAFAGLANYRTASSPVVVCTATLNPPDKEAAEKNRPDIPRAVLKTRVPPKTVGVVKPTDNAVTEINSLADWNEKIGSGTAPVVVKFYQDGCRACRAMKPRFDKLAVELGAPRRCTAHTIHLRHGDWSRACIS